MAAITATTNVSSADSSAGEGQGPCVNELLYTASSAPCMGCMRIVHGVNPEGSLDIYCEFCTGEAVDESADAIYRAECERYCWCCQQWKDIWSWAEYGGIGGYSEPCDDCKEVYDMSD